MIGFEPKSFYTASVAPTSDDDIDRGYSEGSTWIYHTDIYTADIYMCINPERDYAAWAQIW